MRNSTIPLYQLWCAWEEDYSCAWKPENETTKQSHIYTYYKYFYLLKSEVIVPIFKFSYSLVGKQHCHKGNCVWFVLSQYNSVKISPEPVVGSVHTSGL